MHFLAKSSYFEGTGAKGWLSKTFFESIGAIPVRRGAGQAALDALDLQRQLLDERLAVALYPEAPVPPTVGSTRAARASPSWLCRPERPSSPSGSSEPTR